MTRALRFLASCFLLLELCSSATSLRASGGRQSGDVVAICGDSITEQSLYSAFIETYLLACQPAKELRSRQFGLSGETSWEFVLRLDSEVMSHRPTVVTTCYGMNDGGYAPIDAQRQLAYRRATTEIVQRFKSGGVRLIVVGSPSAVDSDSFGAGGPNWIGAEEYNIQTLRGLTRIARELATEEGVTYADVHGLFCEVMANAKAKFGPHYHVAGADGVHPAANGHLIIAYTFLKALGCEGDIGSIKVDLAENRATASEGHHVLSFDGELLEIESARYPFCFYGDPHSPDSTRGILPVLPFNAELNRFQLIVTAAPTARLKVTCGDQSKIFLAGQLASGINLGR
jgi:lysophospholipase L1-like esterase